MCCKENDFWLIAYHLPGVLNIEADKSSRKFNERTEWQLHPGVFSKITDILGTPKIDLFACGLNNQLPKYVSWNPDPGAFTWMPFLCPEVDNLLTFFLPFLY